MTFEAEDPQLAAQIVNTHLQNFVEQNFRSKYDATIQASNWLSSELEELRIKVEKSENARIAYERANQIWQIDEKQDIATSKPVSYTHLDVYKRQTSPKLGLLPSVLRFPAKCGWQAAGWIGKLRSTGRSA